MSSESDLQVIEARVIQATGDRWEEIRDAEGAVVVQIRAMLETCGSAAEGERKGCTFPVIES